MKKPKHPFKEKWYPKVSNNTQAVALEVYFEDLEKYRKFLKTKNTTPSSN